MTLLTIIPVESIDTTCDGLLNIGGLQKPHCKIKEITFHPSLWSDRVKAIGILNTLDTLDML